jgi:uncharacterized protein YjbI with pentapeptide repeats
MTENFKNRDLRGHVFRGQDLADADFSGADIRGADFTNATLTNANFYQARSGVLPSWAIAVSTLMAASAVVMNFLAAMFAGVCVGPLINMGAFSILFGGITCLSVVAIFVFSAIRQGFRKAATASLSLNVLTFVTLVLIALAGGALGFVPMTGVVSVARGLTGGIAGLFVGNSLIAAIVISSVALTIARNVSAWGAMVTAVLGLGTLGMGAGYAIIMSVAMSVVGRGGLEKLLPSPSFAGSMEAQVNMTPAQSWALVLAAGGPHTGTIALTGAIVITLLVGLSSLYLSRQILMDTPHHGGIRQFATAIATFRGTCFQGAALERANFTEATLIHTNFLKARLTQALWYQAKSLHRARLDRTYLERPDIRRLVITRNGQGYNFDTEDLRRLNLQGMNLRNASFVDANLYQADLQGADLTNAKLVRTQLDSANLQEARLTGACIKNWGITKTTQFAKVKCDFVYLDEEQEAAARFPSAEQGDFKRGQFLWFLRPYLNSVDFPLERNFDLNAVAAAFERLAQKHQQPLQIVGVERKQTGDFSLKVKLPDLARSDIFQQDYQNYYQQVFHVTGAMAQSVKVCVAKIDELMQVFKSPTSTHIENLTVNGSGILTIGRFPDPNMGAQEYKLSDLLLQLRQQMMKLLSSSAQVQASEHLQKLSQLEPPLTFPQQKRARESLRALRGISLTLPTDISSTQEVGRLLQKIDQEIFTMNPNEPPSTSQISIGTINSTQGPVVVGNHNTVTVEAQKANLAEVAAEIQQLLSQLSQTNPTTTFVEQADVVEQTIEKIKQNPPLEAKLKGVLWSSGKESLKQAVNHPLMHIFLAAIEGWSKAK